MTTFSVCLSICVEHFLSRNSNMDKFVKWIMDELEFCPSSGTDREAASLKAASQVYKGTLMSDWDRAAARVRSRVTVARIRGNLKLASHRNKKTYYDDDLEAAENKDEKEGRSVQKLLARTTRAQAEVERDIERNRRVCRDLGQTQAENREKVLRAIKRTFELSKKSDEFRAQSKLYSGQSEALLVWEQSLDRAGSDQVIDKTVNELKPILKDVFIREDMRTNADAILRQLVDSRIAKVLVQLAQTLRDLAGRVEAETSTIPSCDFLTKDPIKDLLKQLWERHVDSFSRAKHAASQKSELDEKMDSFLSTVNHHGHNEWTNETVMRLLKLMWLQKYGKAILEHLKESKVRLEKELGTVDGCKDINAKVDIVDSQSKMLATKKNLVDKLLLQTRGTRDRITDLVRTIDETTEQISDKYMSTVPVKLKDNRGIPGRYLEGLENLTYLPRHQNLKYSVPHEEMTLYRFCGSGAQKISGIPTRLGILYPANCALLLQKVIEEKVKARLSNMMEKEMIGLLLGKSSLVLEEYLEKMSMEKSQLIRLMASKLSGVKQSHSGCKNMVKAVHVWAKEPANEAYSRTINPTYKEKTLSKWYEEFRGAR